jgi:hypothetical protein
VSEKGFYKGNVQQMLSVNQEGTRAVTVVAVNCHPFLEAKLLHYVGLLDVFGPPPNEQGNLKLLGRLYQQHRASQNPAGCHEVVPDDEDTPTSIISDP